MTVLDVVEPLRRWQRRVYLLLGEAGEAELVEVRANLIVMGTGARTGPSEVIMGNTAEMILRRLCSSVPAAKPDGFVSSIRVDGGT